MERESSDGRNETTSSVDANESLKVAIAMALFRSKLVQNPNHPPPPSTDLPPTSDALKWKRKVPSLFYFLYPSVKINVYTLVMLLL